MLWDLYSEARQAQEDRSGAGGGVGTGAQGTEASGPTQGTLSAGRAGMFALGVMSRLLTVLRLMYSVSDSISVKQTCPEAQQLKHA